jgi:hypothetical protein
MIKPGILTFIVGWAFAGIVVDECLCANPSPRLEAELAIAYRTLSGRTSVAIRRQSLQAGDPLTLELEFRCDGGAADVYDSFLCMHDPNRASLRIFDATGHFVGNALAKITSNENAPGRWVRVQEATITGRVLQIETGELTVLSSETRDMKDDRTSLKVLGPGKYSAQLVLFGRFLDVRVHGGESPVLRPGIDGSKEICRSNVLEIEVRSMR